MWLYKYIDLACELVELLSLKEAYPKTGVLTIGLKILGWQKKKQE